MIDLPALLTPHKLSPPFTTRSDFESVLNYKMEDLLGDHFKDGGKLLMIHTPKQESVDKLLRYGIPMETEEEFKANIANHLQLDWSFA